GMLYGLIAFVIVAVASLGGFVWQLTGNKELQNARDQAQRRLDKYGNPPSYYTEEATARNSQLFAVMHDDLKALAELASGQEDAVRPAIAASAGRLLKQVAEACPAVNEGDSLLAALSSLHEDASKLRDENAALTAELKVTQQAKQDAEDNLQTVREEFETQVAELQEEFDQVARQSAEQLTAKDEQFARQQAEAEAIGEELSRANVAQQTADRNHEIEVHRLKEDLTTLQDQIQVLKLGGFDPYEILTKADGRVLRAIPGSDVIYINLGEKDRIKPGLTFEVFSPTAAGERDGFRGKASVEVAAVMDTTAECLVTRAVRGRPIVEGDVVVNIAYERNRLPKFVVRGEFDLNYDAQNDWDGLEKVTAIIQAWGGQVVDSVDENTDFLVVGTGPQVPELLTERPVSDVIRDLTDSRLDRLTAYERDIEQARTLYIPIITQSQFLFLTGYSGQGPILSG
ncbi:MAG: hypothetical protein KKI02_06340, partial [Planctomycetes bacterium]|nr:hypothetical protein [Planctomycetota bacterium]